MNTSEKPILTSSVVVLIEVKRNIVVEAKLIVFITMVSNTKIKGVEEATV